MIDVKKMIAQMTDDEKIGQLFMLGIHGTTLSDNSESAASAIDLIKNYNIGGIILFARNITGGEQIAKMIREIKSHAKFPPAVSIDQEGGLVLRLTTGATVMPGNMALAACPDDQSDNMCGMWGEITAKELRNLGFTLNLAPVLDINCNPQNPGIGARSFSDSPEICSKLGTALIKSVQKNGLSACAKHFPGKGNAAVDAHLDLPSIPSTLQEMENFELIPFKNAINSGVDAVMTAHVVFSGIPGENLPATLSHGILTGLLKEKLGFKGALITDDMEMGAIAKYYPQDEACFKSFMAGADIILICHTKELQVKTINLFKEKLRTGELPLERLNDALTRILNLKARFENHKSAASETIDFKKHENYSMIAAEKSITLVSDKNQVLKTAASLKNGIINIFEPKFSAITQVEDIEEKSPFFTLLSDELKNNGNTVNHIIYNVKITDDEISKILSETDFKNSVNIILTYNGHLFRKQIELGNKIYNLTGNLIAAAVRNPYDLALINENAARIATFGFRKNNMTALFELIAGKIAAQGKLPVSFEKVKL
ncbi:MAG: beta-N-acetylhexosaminidase [Candidatus Wallbacteria bacterium]